MRNPLSVIVTQLPEPSSKPLFVAVAAFIVSVVTATFTIYETQISSQETTLDTVGKLIDQYYVGQEKLENMDEDTQLARMNLLRSQVQSIAARTFSLAKRVEGIVDGGTWLAIAQINESEHDNLKIAETAWLTATENTKDIHLYLYAKRNLASNQFRQGKTDEAGQSYQAALDVAQNGKVTRGNGKIRILGTMPPVARYSQVALTHAYWLVQFGRYNCPFVTLHFDSSLRAMADASRGALVTDVASDERILATRVLLRGFQKAREACAPPPVGIQLEDDCYLFADILDNASTGFRIYQGTSDKGKSEYRSRIPFSGTEYCGISSTKTFYCTWPESDTNGAESRFNRLAEILVACKSIGLSTPLVSVKGQPQEISLPFVNRADVKIRKVEANPMVNDGRWKFSFSIEPNIRK
jgi:hypothetical protein